MTEPVESVPPTPIPDDADQGIAAWTVFRPVATLMVVVAVAVFGWISYRQLPINLMPELSYPTLTIRTELVGAAPQEIEQNLTRPIEEIVRTVEGVVALQSVSRAGRSDVVLRFAWDTDMDFAMQKVRERLEIIPFPPEAESPLLLRYDPALDPFMRIGVWGGADAAELRRVTEDEVQRALEKVEGVAMVRVRGGEEEIVRVELDPGRMAFLGVSAADVANRLAAENINLAGGALSEGDVTYLVRTLNSFEDVSELRELIVAYPEGRPVRLDQIAVVKRDVRDAEVLTRIGSADGVHDAVVVEVFKEADANLVRVSAGVQAALFGSPEALERRARTLAQDRATRVGSRAVLVARSDTGLAVGQPLPRSDVVADRLPAGTRLTVLGDQAVFIKRSIDEVTGTALWGGLFAVLVLLLFLRNVWSTVIIAIAIPLSVISAFGALRLADVSLNVMSLGGIALGIGMLVDNSIVVLESIFRCREEGDDVVEAALRGTREVAGAVVASTLTTIAVFFPIVFVGGVAGQIFGDLALSVVFALIASLAVALFFVPMLASRRAVGLAAAGPREALASARLGAPLGAWLEAKADWMGWLRTLRTSDGAGRLVRTAATPIVGTFLLVRLVLVAVLELVLARIGFAVLLFVGGGLAMLVRLLARVLRVLSDVALAAFDVAWGQLTNRYPTALRGALRVPLLVLTIAGASFAWSVWAFGDLGTELLPQMHQGEFTVQITMPVGTRLSDTSRAVERFERELTEVEGVSRFTTTIGVERTEIQAEDQGEHTARIAVLLMPAENPEARERLAMQAARELGRAIPGAQVELQRPTLFTLQTPLEVEIFGDDLRLLRRASDQVREELGAMGALEDVKSNLGRGFPEARITFNRDRLAALGLTARQVGESVRDQVRGLEPTELRQASEDLAIVVRTDPGEVPNVEALQNLIVRPRTQETPEVRLSSVATIALDVGPSEIRRVDGRRAAVVEADVPLVSLSSAAQAVRTRLRAVPLPGGVSAVVAGQSVEMDRALDALFYALLLAVFLVYVVLASKFESLRGPLVILLSIPLSLFGVTVTLLWLDVHVSVLVFIGLIMLAGIVVNNAIVLVDYINQVRDRGVEMIPAIVEACAIRLRPVLITTLTTVLGLMPMALGLGEGAELRKPMGLTVIGGLTSATLLTLLVVPVLYRALMRDLSNSPAPEVSAE